MFLSYLRAKIINEDAVDDSLNQQQSLDVLYLHNINVRQQHSLETRFIRSKVHSTMDTAYQ